MTGRSLLAESMEREAALRQALERVLALAEVMDTSSSAHVRTAATTLRTVIAQPAKEHTA
jgi:hypothetical protein